MGVDRHDLPGKIQRDSLRDRGAEGHGPGNTRVLHGGEIRSQVLPALQVTAKSRILNREWMEAIELENLLDIAEAMATSSLLRKETRGAHYRSDFPDKHVAWLKNICMRPRADGGFDMTYEPVQFTRLAPPEPEAPNMGLKTVVSLIDE